MSRSPLQQNELYSSAVRSYGSVSDNWFFLSFSRHMGMLSFQPFVTLLASRSQVHMSAGLSFLLCGHV